MKEQNNSYELFDSMGRPTGIYLWQVTYGKRMPDLRRIRPIPLLFWKT